MKKLLLSMLATFLVIGLVGASTFAWFQDTETSTGNTFSAGTMDLWTRDGNEDWNADGVSQTWSISGMKPGDVIGNGLIGLRAEGSISPNHLEITSDYSVTEEVPQTEADTDPNTDANPDSMAKEIIITQMHYYDDTWQVDLLTDDGYDSGYDVGLGETGPKVEDVDGDGKISVYDLKFSQSGNGVDDLTPPDGATWLDMTLKFDDDADSRFQGDTFNLTMTFTLNQDSSQ